VDGCFTLLRARQHCVAKTCYASPKANAHKLQNEVPKHDPTLSVLVMLVSRGVFHVVSALQSIACLHTFFWLIRSLVDPTLAAFIVCDPSQFLVSHFFFMPVCKKRNSCTNTINPGIFLGQALWKGSVSPPMHTDASRGQFNSIRIRENLVVNYKTRPRNFFL